MSGPTYDVVFEVVLDHTRYGSVGGYTRYGSQVVTRLGGTIPYRSQVGNGVYGCTPTAKA